MTDTTTFVNCEACTVATMPSCLLCSGTGIVDAKGLRDWPEPFVAPSREDVIAGKQKRRPRPSTPKPSPRKTARVR